MTNDLVGIAGVLVVVLVLFVVRYFILNVGRAKNKRQIIPATHRTSIESKKPREDDAWLLWSADADQIDSSTPVRDQLAERRARAERKGSSQQL